MSVVFFLQESHVFFDVINKNLNGKKCMDVDKSHKKGKMLKDITKK